MHGRLIYEGIFRAVENIRAYHGLKPDSLCSYPDKEWKHDSGLMHGAGGTPTKVGYLHQRLESSKCVSTFQGLSFAGCVDCLQRTADPSGA